MASNLRKIQIQTCDKVWKAKGLLVASLGLSNSDINPSDRLYSHRLMAESENHFLGHIIVNDIIWPVNKCVRNCDLISGTIHESRWNK